MSDIKVNDIFDELFNENKRLLNELLFADKCLKCLTEFKSFVNLVINKINNYLEANDMSKYREFVLRYEEIMKGEYEFYQFIIFIFNNVFNYF